MTRPGSVLVVCTGNVCRSPYIERRLRHELAGTGIEVGSAGTRALVGHDMDAGTRTAAGQGDRRQRASCARELTADLLASASTSSSSPPASTAPPRPGCTRPRWRRTFTLRDLADLLSGVTDERFPGAARSDISWVRKVAETPPAAVRWCPRGSTGVDITDPIGGPPSLFARMAAEVDDALVPVVLALRRIPKAEALRLRAHLTAGKAAAAGPQACSTRLRSRRVASSSGVA